MNVACFDVYYYDTYAKAACIIYNSDNENIISQYVKKIQPINTYIPGEFYKLELPCIKQLLQIINENIDLIITDSFVHLENGSKGLGVYLYESLHGKIPIIGVAKNFYKDASNYIEVYRGESKNPLYVSSIGYDLNESANYIKNLNGKYRIPFILKEVDKLSRI